jgi:DNA-binding transcriptional LysR family regulator
MRLADYCNPKEDPFMYAMGMKFILSAEEAELLVQFEVNPGLDPLARTLGRDRTVISKQLKKIASKGDFLTKVAGRWAITETGKQYNDLTKDYLLSLNRLAQGQTHLKIGATREFAANILATHGDELFKAIGASSVSIHAYEDGVEKALLSGQIDLGFDCGRPYSPEIKYKLLLKEPIVAVASSSFFKKVKEVKKFKELGSFSHILCDRLAPDQVSKKDIQLSDIRFRTNDIATAKNLCLAGHGWALLPKYSIAKEIKSKRLKVIGDFVFEEEKFGVWALRTRVNLTPFYDQTISWLTKNQDLLG